MLSLDTVAKHHHGHSGQVQNDASSAVDMH
jgi:hypothetical protein